MASIERFAGGYLRGCASSGCRKADDQEDGKRDEQQAPTATPPGRLGLGQLDEHRGRRTGSPEQGHQKADQKELEGPIHSLPPFLLPGV